MRIASYQTSANLVPRLFRDERAWERVWTSTRRGGNRHLGEGPLLQGCTRMRGSPGNDFHIRLLDRLLFQADIRRFGQTCFLIGGHLWSDVLRTTQTTGIDAMSLQLVLQNECQEYAANIGISAKLVVRSTALLKHFQKTFRVVHRKYMIHRQPKYMNWWLLFLLLLSSVNSSRLTDSHNSSTLSNKVVFHLGALWNKSMIGLYCP